METWVEKFKGESRENRIIFEREAIELEVADKLFEAMQENNLSKAEFARKIGKSKAYVTRLLRGDYNLTIGSLAELAYMLGAKVEISFVPQKKMSGKNVIRFQAKSKRAAARGLGKKKK